MVQINEILGNTVSLKLILFFARHPSLQISQTEAIKRLHISKATAVKWFGTLVQTGILSLTQIGTTNLYQFTKDNLFSRQIKILDNLFSLTGIRNIAIKHSVDIYLFGSLARGEDHEGSDIDLLVIGSPDRKKLLIDLISMSKSVEREIRPQIFTQLEWAELFRKDPAFYQRVEKDKILL